MPAFTATSAQRPSHAVDPRLEQALRQTVLIGVVAVLLLPAARGHNAWLGWMPLWLLGMPLTAWWALHRFRLPRRTLPPALRARRRRPRVQARRRTLPGRPGRLPQAA